MEETKSIEEIKNWIKKHLPYLKPIYHWTRYLISILSPIYYWIRLTKLITRLYKPLYKRSHEFIEIDITLDCELTCFNCDRSCRQAPTKESMTIEQIRKFINESVINNIEWKRIRILGGEPTMHPDILKIINLLVEYKNKYSPFASIQLSTHGLGKKTKETLLTIPKDIEICNTNKNSQINLFSSFNVAPIDKILYKYSDYSNGCWVTAVCGIGLTRHGFYPCAVAGSIDRVFGFDCGRKELPSKEDLMTDQLKTFCKLCGHFKENIGVAKLISKGKMSLTWEKAYRRYSIKKPTLLLY